METQRSLTACWSLAKELSFTLVGEGEGEGGEVKQAPHGFYRVHV